jgi:hypothetical protein
MEGREKEEGRNKERKEGMGQCCERQRGIYIYILSTWEGCKM